MGNYLVIKDSTVNFSDVAVNHVSFIEDIPKISISGGVVTITPGVNAVATYYTIDGSDPTTSSQLYTTPFTVQIGTTVNAISVLSNGLLSGIGSETYLTWTEINLEEYLDTGKAINSNLVITDSTNFFESYVIPVTSSKTMRITACTWGSENYSPCGVYLRNQNVETASIIGKVNIIPTSIDSGKSAACFDKVQFVIPNNVSYLFIQGRTQGNANFVDGYDLKLEEYG